MQLLPAGIITCPTITCHVNARSCNKSQLLLLLLLLLLPVSHLWFNVQP
jgi:hypothetical protein